MTNQKVYSTPNRWRIINEEEWRPQHGETSKEYENRVTLNRKAFQAYVQAYGTPFVVRFGPGDMRVLWGKEINPDKLRQEILSPIGTHYDCPLCQPYDSWNGYGNTEDNRNFLCKVIDHNHVESMSDGGGVWMKCPCLKTRPSSRR